VSAPVEPAEIVGVDKAVRSRYHLENGHVRVALIRALAEGKVRRATLARQLDVTAQAILYFARRHEAEIKEVRENFESEFAGLWVAAKRNRVAAYEDEINRLQDMIDTIMTESASYRLVPDPEALTKLYKARDRAIRSVAEELGALPQRIQMQITEPVRHILDIPGAQDGDLT
jgi:transposase-like protein